MRDLDVLHICTILLVHVEFYLTPSSRRTYVFLTGIFQNNFITFFVISGMLCNYVLNFTLVILNSVTFCAAFSNAFSLVEAVDFYAVTSLLTFR